MTETAKSLQAELATAQKEAEERRVAAEKANTDLEALKTTSKGLTSRVTEVKNLLQDASARYDTLEAENKKKDLLVSELTQSVKEERSNACRYQQEFKMVEDIAAGKPLCRLMRVWRLVESGS